MKTHARFWVALVVAFLALDAAIAGVTLYLALGDPSAAVEPDYYQKALAWDESARLTQRARDLGWNAALKARRNGFVLTLTDRDGLPVRDAAITYEAFHNARSGQRLTGALVPAEAGEYRADTPLPLPGLWQFRFRIHRAGDDAAIVLEHQVTGERL